MKAMCAAFALTLWHVFVRQAAAIPTVSLRGHDNRTDNSISANYLHSKSRRRVQDCPSLYPTDVEFMITKEFMEKVGEIMSLATIIQISENGPIEDHVDDLRKIYERFDGWTSKHEEDQTCVAKTKDSQTCFAVFMGSNLNVPDQAQNVNPFRARVGESDCQVRKGYLSAYNSTYSSAFRQSLEECIASCDGGCPLVLGGHSQGGSAAVVGSIDLIHYNPEVITFGAPRAILDSSAYKCTTVNSTQHFRFINTLSNQFDLVVNQIDIFNEKHVGWPLFLDEVNFPIAISSLDDNKNRRLCSLAAHDRERYVERVEKMASKDCFPIPVTRGWPTDHYCTNDVFCQSHYCDSWRKVCREGL